MYRHRQLPLLGWTALQASRLRNSGRNYCRLTLAFVIGLYLPTALGAPDLARHFGEALHSWTIIFFAPLALWGLLAPSGRPVTVRKSLQDKLADRCWHC